MIWVPTFAGMCGLVLAGCSPKPKVVDTFAEARKAVQAKLGPDATMRSINTSIRHGAVAICGLAGAEPHRFVYADSKLTLDTDVSDGELRALAAEKCSDFKWPNFPAPQSRPAKP